MFEFVYYYVILCISGKALIEVKSGRDICPV